MSVTSRYPIVKSTGEIFQVAMDFSQVLNSGATLNTATIVYTPYDGLLGITNTTTTSSGVSFVVSSGVANTNYRLQITVATTDAETLVGEGILKIRNI